jgi:hypothetical protein
MKAWEEFGFTNADWGRVVQARTERGDLRPQRVWDAAQGRARRGERPQGSARRGRRDRAHG